MRLRHAVLGLVGLLAATAPLVAGGAGTARILERIDAARVAAGAPALSRRDDLDGVAARRARRIAALPHSRRLSYGEPVESELREAGIRWFATARSHLDLSRGYEDPAAAFADNWERFREAWSSVLDPRLDSIGLGLARADDGWVVFVAVLLEETEPPEEPATLERRTLEAVNDVRAEHGLSRLSPLDTLSRVARAHSEDMARRDYVAHRSPDGFEAADRVQAAGLHYAMIGENLHMSRGYRDPVGRAVEAWMRSPAHRKAMLEPDYVETGVGVAVAEDGSIYFTQLFFRPAGASATSPPR